MTTDDDDAIRVLAEADPAAAAAAFDPASARGQELLQRAKTVAPKRRRSRPRLVVVVAVGAAAAAAAAAAFVNTRQPDAVLYVGCFEKLEGARIHLVTTTKASAVEACLEVWNGGKFFPTPTPSRLVGCIVKDRVRVYPGGPETCAKLQAPLAPDNVRAARALVELSKNIDRAIFGCIPPEQAEALVRKAIDDAGEDVEDWDVARRGEFNEEQPCAGAQIDEPGHRVFVQPGPRPEGG